MFWVVLLAALVAFAVVQRRGRSNCSGRRRWRGRVVCPNVFDQTSVDLWPCAAEQQLAALNLDPSRIRRCVPAVFPWEPSYNTLRLNVDLQQQRQPLFIVRPRSGEDISKTICLAKTHNTKVSVRSGGHCNESFSIFNPIVISIGCLNHIHLDECTGIVTCGGGVTQGQIFKVIAKAKKSFAFALAHRHHGGVDLGINTGNAADVGLSGVLGAGGVGFLQRQLGLTIDSVKSLRVVLADGWTVKATPDNQFSDLWVAMRGSGGGNFGVISEIQLQLHEIPSLIVFTLKWTDWAQAAAVFQTWQTLAPNFPNSLTQQLYFVIAEGAGVPAVSSAGVFVGTDQAQLASLLAPFLAIPTASIVYEASTFAGQARKFASGRVYHPFAYRRIQFAFAPLDNSGIATLIGQVEAAVGIPGAHTLEFDPFGGRVAEIPLDSSAFYPRAAQFWLLFATAWSDQSQSDANMLWSQTIFDTMRPLTSQFVYSGFMILNLANYLNAYYGTRLPMLQQAKAKYDPTNFFTYPQSIPLP